MIAKLKEKLENTNKLTKMLFRYGFIFSFIIFILGMYLLISAINYQDTFTAQELIRASVSVFSEFVICAIFFDFLTSSNA